MQGLALDSGISARAAILRRCMERIRHNSCSAHRIVASNLEVAGRHRHKALDLQIHLRLERQELEEHLPDILKALDMVAHPSGTKFGLQ
jgi:hypothetical protein